MSFCSCESGMEEPACFLWNWSFNSHFILIQNRFLKKWTSNLYEKAVGEATPNHTNCCDPLKEAAIYILDESQSDASQTQSFLSCQINITSVFICVLKSPDTRCSPPLSWVRVPLWYLAQQPGLVCLYVSRGDSQLEGWAAMEGMTALNERLCLVTSVESCWSELDSMDLLTFDPTYSRRVLISFVFHSKIVTITQNSTCVMAHATAAGANLWTPCCFPPASRRWALGASQKQKRKYGTNLFMTVADGSRR